MISGYIKETLNFTIQEPSVIRMIYRNSVIIFTAFLLTFAKTLASRKLYEMPSYRTNEGQILKHKLYRLSYFLTNSRSCNYRA